jgi:hypothetical protein
MLAKKKKLQHMARKNVTGYLVRGSRAVAVCVSDN